MGHLFDQEELYASAAALQAAAKLVRSARGDACLVDDDAPGEIDALAAELDAMAERYSAAGLRIEDAAASGPPLRRYAGGKAVWG